MAIEYRAIRGETGQMLRDLLLERGVQIRVGGEAVVSYGVTLPHETRPTLNASAGRLDKLAELTRLQTAGVRVPPFSRDGSGLVFPILGRNVNHTRARDIVLVPGNDITLTRARRIKDYFTQYVPLRTEYRVWAYRRRSLAVYEKVMRFPERARGFGNNWENGYAFEFVEAESRPTGLADVGTRAVDALGLDFGAVDVLHGTDGNFHVLEVNTAPGVQDRRQGIVALADKIARWVELRYPNRRGDENAEQGARTRRTR